MMQLSENGRLLNVGVIGLGGRGRGQLKLVSGMQDVKILAVCDVYEDRMKQGMEIAQGAIGTQDYHDILNMPEIEAIFIFTDWNSHIRIAIEAMKAGKVVVVQTAPATRVAIAEEFGQTPGTIGTKKMVGGLKVFCAVSSHVLETRLQLRLRYQRRCRYHHHGRGNRVP